MPTSRLHAVLLAAAFSLASGWTTPALQASDLSTPLDFAQLSRIGMEEAVDGSYVIPGPLPFPDLPVHPDGDYRNSYPWSMAWWGPGGGEPALWVGTVRSLFCFLSPDLVDPEECPAATPDQPLPLPRFPQEAAEIWKYVPGGEGGIEGTWTRVFGGPTPTTATVVPWPTKCFLQPSGDILGCLFTLGNGYPDFPQHIGIRTMVACDADGSGTTELYAGNLGIPAQILYTEDGTNWLDASTAGDTFVSTADLTGGTVDLGYRGLVCWQGKVCTAPAGSFEDTDSSLHPWVICNDDPTDQSSPWVAHSEYGFGDPDDIGIFDMVVVDVEPPLPPDAPEQPAPAGSAPTATPPIDGEEWLCAGGFDRINGGSVWCTDGSGCDVDVSPADGVRDCVWTEYVADGMGRPSQFLGIDAGGAGTDAAGFGFGTFDNDDDPYDDYLYYGMADAAGGPNANNALAEMGRINLNRTAEAFEGAPGATLPDLFGTWELVVGIPRNTTDLSVLAGYGLTTSQFVPPAEMNCTTTPVNLRAVIFAFFGVDVGFDIPSDLCMPISGRGIGMADIPFDIGTSTYFWRFIQHQGDLFVGDLDTGDFNGFELWKTSDGTTFDLITDDGFGWGESNYGVRGLVSTDPTPGEDNVEPTGPWISAPLSQPALFVGAANPFGGLPGGGAQVWMGTTEPMVPPVGVIDPLPLSLLFDNENCPSIDSCSPGDGMVMVSLDGTDSFDTFGGSVVDHRWYSGDVEATCDTLIDGDAISIGATFSPTVAAGGGAGIPYTYTLRVKDDDDQVDCATESFIASSNLPPFAEILTDPPATLGTVRLVDFDGDGEESFAITARCLDPEATLTECFWDVLDGGLTFDPPRALGEDVESPITNTYVGAVTALIEEDALAMFGDDSPDAKLQGEDGFFTGSSSIDVRVESVVDTPDTNDAPDCASGRLTTLKNTVLTMSPGADTNPVEAPRCVDADVGETATLVYEIDGDENFGAPTYGSGTAATITGNTLLEYTPGTDETGDDLFRFQAYDVGAAASNEVNVAVDVIDCPAANGLPDHVYLVIDGVTYTSPGPDTETGCYTLTSINSTTVETGADVTFQATQRVVLESGFAVQDGAAFTVKLDPSLVVE